MSKIKNGNLSTSKKITRKQRLAATIILCLAILLVFDFTPYGGSLRFYQKWLSCGHKPLASSGPGFFNEGVPHYINPPGFELVRLSQPQYFCSPLQAERAGFSADPHEYRFNYLNK